MNNKFIIISDIIFIGLMVIILILCSNSYIFWIGYANIFVYIIFLIIMIECILIIIFILINIFKQKIKPNIYLNNIPLIIFSIIFIFNIIGCILGGVLYIGIPLIIAGIKYILFQIYYINNCENNKLKLITTILVPILYFIISIFWLGYNF